MMLLTEILNQPYKWSIETHNEDNFSAKFIVVDGDKVTFQAYRHETGEWEISFVKEDDKKYKFGITGEGDAFKMFATVSEIFHKFMKFYEPSSFSFDAKEDEESRVKLYKKFSKMISLKYGYSFKINKSHDKYTTYEFEKL